MSHCEKQRKTSSWSSRGQYSSLRAPVVGSHRLWCWLTVFLREQYSSSLPEIRTHPGKNRDPQVSHTDTFAPPLSATHTYTQSWTQRRVFFFYCCMKSNMFTQISSAKRSLPVPNHWMESCVKHDAATPGESVQAQLGDLFTTTDPHSEFTARLVFQISSLPVHFLSCLANKPKGFLIHMRLPYAWQTPRAIRNTG